MPFNGSGAFAAPGTSFPAIANTLIESAKFNAIVNDIATGLTNCVTKDGQTTITANLPMAGYRHTGVGSATARDNYATAGQVQDNGLVYAASVGTDTYTATLTPSLTAYVTGMDLAIHFGNANTSTTPTLNVNSVGAKTIVRVDGTAVLVGEINGEHRLRYDGTNLRLLNSAGTVTATGTQTLTNKTMTSPVINTPTFSANAVTTAAILDNNVTNAKLAQMAAHTLKANITGVTGNVVDSTLSAILDAELSSTQGSIAYRSGSGWVALGPGTSGQALTSGGGAANVAWTKRNACMQFFSGLTTIPAGATRFLGGGVDSTESTIRFRAPFNCTAKALYAICSTAPTAGQTFTYVLMVNGGAGNNTCVISDTAISNEDTAHSDTFTAGQTITVRVITSASAASATHSVTVELQAT